MSVETNVFDFDKDVYGNRVEVALYHFLRQEMKFENVEALKKQMESDASFAKEMFLTIKDKWKYFEIVFEKIFLK